MVPPPLLPCFHAKVHTQSNHTRHIYGSGVGAVWGDGPRHTVCDSDSGHHTHCVCVGVTAGCGCTFWRQRVTGGIWSTLRYEVKITAEEIDPQRAHKGPRKKAHTLASTLNLDWPYGNKDYPDPIRPSDVFHTKEQLQFAVAKARHAGTRPDTSRVVKRPARE